MEKIAIISDVHGCYVSLEAVLKDIASRNITTIFMLGDLVAKGSEPKKVLECIREKCTVVIKGNCDNIIAENYGTQEHKWNIEKIGKENQEYLKSLPLYYDFYMSGLKFRLMHASPNSLSDSINYYNITDNIYNKLDELFDNTDFLSPEDTTRPDVIIFGHIHSPFLYRLGNKMVVNSGSVSNSCDIIEKNGEKKIMASYMILEGEYGSKDISTISYEIVKVPFDYKKEIENLKNSDMPNKEMAIRELETGIYVKR